ncbi:MFS transporter [Paracoccus aerodenitrificans]|uniref:MFS transporter n=1 Tax=Paracoccus aerodenitrificans TaxID=3017781 RepID=UPI0022F026FB|nr:MFS transporter [Paracoccus aerodenitrificans]WBU65102.1 MFS transporter [Paracoccus aerodenitrificans]
MTAPTPATPPPVRQDPRAIALLLAASLTVMAAATISPALPGIQREFPDTELNRLLVRLLVPAPSLSVVLTAWLCGIFTDRIGRRPLLLSGVALFAVAGSAGLFLHDLNALLASRLLLGVALAMVMTAQSALSGDYFSGNALHTLIGAQVAARNLGGFVFITLAAALAVHSPRLPFVVYAIPALMLPFFSRVIAETPRHSASDRTDASSEHQGWQIRVALLALGKMLVTIIFFVMPTQLPFYLQDQGFGAPAMSGAGLAALMLAGGATAILYPRIRNLLGDGGNWACGFLVMASGFALLVSTASASGIIAACAAIGAGYALSTPGFVALSLTAAPPSGRGRTGAILTASVFLGQFLSPFISLPAIGYWGWHIAGIGLAAGLVATAILVAITSRLYRPA